MWYDAFGRMTDQVEYGTYGGSDFDRDALSVPARSDTALRTSYTYDTDGTLKETTDPKALVTRYEYDAAGRKTKEIHNYGDGTPSGTDSDQTVVYGYTDGLLTTLTADTPRHATRRRPTPTARSPTTCPTPRSRPATCSTPSSTPTPPAARTWSPSPTTRRAR